MATDNWENNGVNLNVNADAWSESKAYRCHVLLIQEEDGTYSGIVMNLPGAGSCGDTEEETLANVREAVCVCYGGVDSYDFHGLESIQCLVERRKGGETGVKWLQAFRGDSFWKALADGVWPAEPGCALDHG